MIRTDIYRLMGERMNIDSSQLGMSYMTLGQMKKKWGKDYLDNYNLVNDCVAATNGMTISCNGQYIEARYTYLLPYACPKFGNIIHIIYIFIIKICFYRHNVIHPCEKLCLHAKMRKLIP